MGWLQEHLNGFVAPVLGGYIPQFMESDRYFTPDDLTIIKNCWRSAKSAAKKRTILLPGRDVFIFEVLARRENYPTLFLPECSRGTAHVLGNRAYNDMMLLDTGFVGSIPMAMGIDKFVLMSQDTAFYQGSDSCQIFPNMTGSRRLALKIEATPKYWETGRLIDGEVVQEISNVNEFTRAALLTIEVYKNSAPKGLVTIEHRPRFRRGFDYVKYFGDTAKEGKAQDQTLPEWY